MSLERFENLDEVLGYTPVFGETLTQSDRSIIFKNEDMPIAAGDLTGNFGDGPGEVKAIIEKHIYADTNLLYSQYDAPLKFKENPYHKLMISPEKDLRDFGLFQGAYSICYNFLHKYAGNADGYSNIKIAEISTDRREVRIKINTNRPKKSQIAKLNQGIGDAKTSGNATSGNPTSKSQYKGVFGMLFERASTTSFNTFNKPGVKQEYVLNFGKNNLYDIVDIKFNGKRQGTTVIELPFPTSMYLGTPTTFIPVDPNALNNGAWAEWLEIYTPAINSDQSNARKPTGRSRQFTIQTLADGKLKFVGAQDWGAPNQPAIYRVPNSSYMSLSSVYIQGQSAYVSQFTSNLNVATNATSYSLSYKWFDPTLTSYDEVVVKLYKALDDSINVNSTTSIYGRFFKSYIEKIIAFPAIKKETFTNFSDPNFNVEYDVVKSGNGTTFQTWNDLLDTNQKTSQEIISHYFSSSLGDMKLNIDYSDFKNYVHFSSATERVDNFVFKLKQIEGYNSRIDLLQTVSGSEAITNISQSVVRRDTLIGGFDDFEKWMYYDVNSTNYTHWSSSAYTIEPYPKVSTFPHILYPTTSSQGENWYMGVYSSASMYDSLNGASLRDMIPIYLLEDEKNDEYITFVDMIGQHFDIQWSYIKALTSINKREEHPEDGMSSDLLNDIASSFGWRLSNGYSDSNLWNYVLGVDSSGSLAQTGLMQSKSRDFITKEVWRRIVNHIPYLYKSKGTARSIKALLSAYGVPQAFLQIREFGGPTISTRKNIFQHERFVNKVETSTYKYIDNPWDDINNDRPSSVEIIGKMPKGNYHIARMYSGSDYVDLLWEYDSSLKKSRVRSTINGTTFMSSSYFTYRDRQDAVFVMTSGSGNSLQASFVDSFGEILVNQNITSSENTTFNDIWNNGNSLRVPGPITWTANHTASIQEVRYYRDIISNEIVTEHAKNREAYFSDDNTTDLDIDTSYDKLSYRIFPDSTLGSISSSVGGNLIIASIHPNQKITESDGGSPLTASMVGITANDLVGEVDTQFMTIPAVGALNLMNNKIRIESSSLRGMLSPDKNVEISEYDYAANDSNLLGTYFSTTDTVNFDIFNSEGYFEIDDWVGDPDERYNQEYPLLKYRAKNYFQKYTTGTALDLILDMLARYDMSIFEQIRQVLPARVDWHKGIMIEPHVLERNKYSRPDKISYTRHFWDTQLSVSPQHISASKHDYGLTSGSGYVNDGVVDLYDYQASTYKYYIPVLSSSGDYYDITNGYWEYSPTGSVITEARPSQNGGQITKLFFSTEASASKNLPSSASYIPSRGSDYQGLSIENLKYNGCRITSDSITTNSPDTPDGGPVVVVTTVDPNKLVFSTLTPGGGGLSVGTSTPGKGKKVQVMDTDLLVSVNDFKKKIIKPKANTVLEARSLQTREPIYYRPSITTAQVLPAPPSVGNAYGIFKSNKVYFDISNWNEGSWNDLTIWPGNTYDLMVNGVMIGNTAPLSTSNTIVISNVNQNVTQSSPRTIKRVYLVSTTTGAIFYRSPIVFGPSWTFNFGIAPEPVEVRIILAT